MAAKPQKTNTTSSLKKQKIPVKRRGGKTTNKSTFKKSIFIVLGVFLMISMVAFGYFLGQHDLLNGQTSIAETNNTDKADSKKKPLKDLPKIKTEKPQETKDLAKKKISNMKKNTSMKPLLEEQVQAEEKPKVVKQKPKVRLIHSVGKPKLVIIIDDVSNVRQLRKIQSLHMKITPSIFPPSERSMRSHTLARGLKHYMIHLPMESGSIQFNKQYKTLKTSFSQKQITARAKELRVLFPTARYINNHTGSVFTDDYKGMLTLYSALKKEGFMFVDSRTIASTKIPKIANEFGDVYLARDTFIDNVHNIKTIHKQLRKAVEIAKKKGHAIAIGHPHAETMKALLSAGSILEDVELVYIDNLMTI